MIYSFGVLVLNEIILRLYYESLIKDFDKDPLYKAVADTFGYNFTSLEDIKLDAKLDSEYFWEILSANLLSDLRFNQDFSNNDFSTSKK